ncbi:MAG TPA: hypothetical protein ENL13_04160, partial [Thermoplasmatales archaeon]|nr:hypothetical protein [Thermoplasmatales archaeon]
IYIGSNAGYIYAINPDGALKWRYKTGKDVLSSPAIDKNGIIYVGSMDGSFYALNPNGTLRWRYSIGDWINSSPAIDKDGTIYIASWDGYLYALEPKDAADLKIEKVKGGVGKIKVTVKNVGYRTAENVRCRIILTCWDWKGLAHTKTFNNTISSIKAGEEKKVKINEITWFGHPSTLIKVEVSADEANPDMTPLASAIIVGPFIVVLNRII